MPGVAAGGDVAPQDGGGRGKAAPPGAERGRGGGAPVTAGDEGGGRGGVPRSPAVSLSPRRSLLRMGRPRPQPRPHQVRPPPSCQAPPTAPPPRGLAPSRPGVPGVLGGPWGGRGLGAWQQQRAGSSRLLSPMQQRGQGTAQGAWGGGAGGAGRGWGGPRPRDPPTRGAAALPPRDGTSRGAPSGVCSWLCTERGVAGGGGPRGWPCPEPPRWSLGGSCGLGDMLPGGVMRRDKHAGGQRHGERGPGPGCWPWGARAAGGQRWLRVLGCRQWGSCGARTPGGAPGRAVPARVPVSLVFGMVEATSAEPRAAMHAAGGLSFLHPIQHGPGEGCWGGGAHRGGPPTPRWGCPRTPS